MECPVEADGELDDVVASSSLPGLGANVMLIHPAPRSERREPQQATWTSTHWE